MLKRSNSLPQLQMGENLMEELGINKDIRVDHLNLQEVMLLQTQNARNAQVKFCNLNQMYPLLNVFLCRCFFWANIVFIFLNYFFQILFTLLLLLHHNPNNTNTYSSNKLHVYVLFIFWNRKKKSQYCYIWVNICLFK